MLTMKSFKTIMNSTFIIFILQWGILCRGETDVDVASMGKAELEALYSTIQGFVGKWWNGSDLYPDPCGWTPIQGVTCDIFDGLWHVTGLSIGPLHDNSLTCAENGDFSPLLFELKHLKSLSFLSCFGSSHLVTISNLDWQKLSGNLESLEFRSNTGLTGHIPDSFSSLTKLQSLVLLENRLIGELPANVGNLINLKRLVLARNGFKGQIPDSLGGLRELLILDLSGNSLSGSLPLTFGGLASLLKLDLSNNQLEGKLPSELGFLKNLTLLDLSNNKFSGGLTQSLQDMYSLEEMILSNNPVGGDLHSLYWQNLRNLVVLDVSSTALTGEIPDSISSLKSLRYLGLRNNILTGRISPKLAALPCIRALYLNGNNLTGELKFPEWFYRKMGNRFEAWDNPNLCLPLESKSTSHAPYGVKPCLVEVKLLEQISKSKLADGNWNQNPHDRASLGFSNYASGGFWWDVSVMVLMVTLTLDCWI